MSKGNGSTRSSSSSNPRGLSAPQNGGGNLRTFASETPAIQVTTAFREMYNSLERHHTLKNSDIAGMSVELSARNDTRELLYKSNDTDSNIKSAAIRPRFDMAADGSTTLYYEARIGGYTGSYNGPDARKYDNLMEQQNNARYSSATEARNALDTTVRKLNKMKIKRD